MARAGGGGDAGVETRLLRRAYEIAFDVAVARQAEAPPRDVPAAVRRFVHFAKLPHKALSAIHRALDEDEDLRREVADRPAATELSAPARLWLERPEGWEARWSALVEEAQAPTAVEVDPKLKRRLEGAEKATDRARREADDLRDQLARARTELAELRRRAQALEAERDDYARQAADLVDQRTRAVQELGDVKRHLERRTAELKELREGPGPAAGAAAPAAPARAPDPATRARVEELVALAARLREGLTGLRAELDPAPEPAVAAPRQPPPLPPGVFEDTLDAAAHLLALPGVLVLVDGYNVAKLGWPALDLAGQRDALVAAVTSFVNAGGAETWVVFDGADVDVARPPARGQVQVRFSPPDVIADDEILAIQDGLPAARRIVVVSNDRKVRDGSRRRGARVVSSDHLLAVLRR